MAVRTSVAAVAPRKPRVAGANQQLRIAILNPPNAPFPSFIVRTTSFCTPRRQRSYGVPEACVCFLLPHMTAYALNWLSSRRAPSR